MRVVAILAAHNEEIFVRPCLEHYAAHGVEVYLLDNDSTDSTVSIAQEFLGSNLITIERLPRTDGFSLQAQLAAKERIARSIEADWVIHADLDEIRLPPQGNSTLIEAFAVADDAGYNAVNFLEFTFVPTLESPDHENSDFESSMLWYYHYRSSPHPTHIKAWKPRELADFRLGDGGHHLYASNRRLSPQDFRFRHYLILSQAHAQRKYVDRKFDPQEVTQGWHTWRAFITPATFRLPSEADLIRYTSDEDLDSSRPVEGDHLIFRKTIHYRARRANLRWRSRLRRLVGR